MFLSVSSLLGIIIAFYTDFSVISDKVTHDRFSQRTRIIRYMNRFVFFYAMLAITTVKTLILWLEKVELLLSRSESVL